ncbi:hypothetical protein, partial [Halobaculum sp. EA56]|uniref:hypothetical protein n=1 Tax=Halobaculum sp. EA56 TaxID=3421648 RepID=UPI003EBE70F5
MLAGDSFDIDPPLESSYNFEKSNHTYYFHTKIRSDILRVNYIYLLTAPCIMSGFQNRSDLFLLDTGSIMLLVFG